MLNGKIEKVKENGRRLVEVEQIYMPGVLSCGCLHASSLCDHLQ